MNAESHLRRSVRRLGFELAEVERGNFHIRRQGSKINETADQFGLDLAGVMGPLARTRSPANGRACSAPAA